MERQRQSTEREKETMKQRPRERVREMERQTETEGGDRRDWPMAAPSSHTREPQQTGSSFLCLQIPICTPRVPRKWQWAPILSPGHQLPIRPRLACWQEPSQEPDLVLLSFGSAVPSHKCRPGAAQMRRRARAHGHARRSLSADDS